MVFCVCIYGYIILYQVDFIQKYFKCKSIE